MKKCTNCKTNLKNDDKFCSKCGTKVTHIDSPKKTESQTTESHKDANSFRPKTLKLEQNSIPKEPSKLSGKKKLIFGAVGALIIFSLAVGYFLTNHNSKSTINLEKYVKIEYGGYDGKGYIVADYPKIDKEALYDDIVEKLSEDNLTDTPFNITDVTDNIKIELYKNNELHDGKNLTNHEELTLRLIYDNDRLNKILPGIHFTGIETTSKAKLIALQAINPFENYRPEFEGISPIGRIKYPSYSEPSSNPFIKKFSTYGFPFKFLRDGKELTDNDNIAVGDVITVSLNESGTRAIEEDGATVSSDNEFLEYTVTLADFEEGSYVTSLAHIQDSVTSDLSTTMEDIAKSYVAGYRSIDSKFLGTPKFEGRAFAKLKDGIEWKLDTTGLGLYRGNSPHLIYIYSIEKERFGSSKTNYIIIPFITITEKVENAGKADVIDNPGKTIQTFDKNPDKYDDTITLEEDEEKLKKLFTKNIDKYNYDMDESLRNLIGWNE